MTFRLFIVGTAKEVRRHMYIQYRTQYYTYNEKLKIYKIHILCWDEQNY